MCRLVLMPNLNPVIAKRRANAFVADAEAWPLHSPIGETVDRYLAKYRARHGGLWVGGTAHLSAQTLIFNLNALNRGIHSEGAVDIIIPLIDIETVSVRRLPVTSAVVVASGSRFLQLRCYRAASFADVIQATATAARSHPPA